MTDVTKRPLTVSLDAVSPAHLDALYLVIERAKTLLVHMEGRGLYELQPWRDALENAIDAVEKGQTK